MFPISLNGSIRLHDLGNPTPYAARVRERLVDLLDEANAYDVAEEGDAVRFKIAFFGGGGRYHPLAPIDRGRFEIEIEDTALRIRYRLSTLRLMVVLTAALAVLFGLAMSDKAVPNAWFPAFAWLWVFGLSYLVAAIRIPFWLKRRLESIAEIRL
ncbi:MAG TPA: hypothetical protein VFV07_12275 [Rhizomicrobium sp.]|nr:hypothetical protein [Rhizomicrobium sp.]